MAFKARRREIIAKTLGMFSVWRRAKHLNMTAAKDFITEGLAIQEDNFGSDHQDFCALPIPCVTRRFHMKFFVTFFQGGGWCRSSTGPVVWQLGERPQAQGQTLETICHWESSHRSVNEWECIRRPRLYTFNYLFNPRTSNSGCQS